ncbi:D-ribose ABC transporter substrate-binding protein [Paeniglutamicibacter sp. MACA_103]|uniref:D-ribose ABC transporter substrate-binding protein n=1 Tax=Paeniglutamicibacter sp. MACA_103 TaxID=3377337 RepID=UPI00389338B7
MKMKRTLSALTAGLLIAATAACGGNSPAPEAASSNETRDVANADSKLITMITNEPANPFWKASGDAVTAEGKSLGYDVTVLAHNGDTKKEGDMVDSAITNKSAAVIMDPANADGSIGAVQKLVAAGIPVFLVNAEINQQGLAKSQLVSNNAQGAALGAEEFVKKMDGKGKYVELIGPASDNNAATRSNGFKTVLSQYPDLKLLDSQVANWDQKLGHDKMQSMLQAHPDIEGVIAGNDQMALGAIAAIKEAGKLDDITVGGFDGNPDAAAAVEGGNLDYSVLQPVVDFSKQAVIQADSYLKSGKTGVDEEKQSFDCYLITKENVETYSDFTLKN